MRIFRNVGGDTVRQHVDGVLARIFTPRMLGQVCLIGKNADKLAFRKTRVCAIMFESVMLKKKCSDDEVLESLRSILKFAHLRKAANA